MQSDLVCSCRYSCLLKSYFQLMHMHTNCCLYMPLGMFCKLHMPQTIALQGHDILKLRYNVALRLNSGSNIWFKAMWPCCHKHRAHPIMKAESNIDNESFVVAYHFWETIAHCLAYHESHSLWPLPSFAERFYSCKYMQYIRGWPCWEAESSSS